MGVHRGNRTKNINHRLYDNLRHCTVRVYRHPGLIGTLSHSQQYSPFVKKEMRVTFLSSPADQVAIADCLNSLVYLYSRKNPNGLMAKSLSLVTGTVCHFYIHGFCQPLVDTLFTKHGLKGHKRTITRKSSDGKSA